MAENKENKLIEYIIFIGAGYFLLVKPILESLGIKNTAQQNAVNTTAPQNNVWSGQPFINSFAGQKIKLLTTAAKDKYSKIIYDALPNIGNDDSSAIISVFRGITTKTQVADLSQYFKNKYNYDLYDFLSSGRSKDFWWSSTTGGLNADNINQVLTIVNAKPNK